MCRSPHLPVPGAVLATKPHRGADWSEGAHRNLADNLWRVRTADPTKLRSGHTVTIRFDSPVAPGLTLADCALRPDRLAKRALCTYALSKGFGGGPLAAAGVGALATRFDWVVRWRLDHGAPSFSALRKGDFDAFVARLRTGSVIGLVDVVTRLDAWVTDVLAGIVPFPTWIAPPFLRVGWGPLARCLGVTPNAIVSSSVFLAELLARLPLLLPNRAAEIAEAATLITPGSLDLPAASMLEGYLAVWRSLREASLRGLVPHDPLLFDPFGDRSPGWLAHRLGKPDARTQTLTPPQLFRLMEAATRWVLEHGPALVKAVAGCADRGLRERGCPANDPPSSSGAERSSESLEMRLDVAVRHLMSACAVLIGSLAARRGGEVRSVKAGCASEPRPGVFELSIYIEKTIRDNDCVAVPALVIEVIRTLEALTLPTRVASGEDWLFRVALPGTGRIIELDLTADLPAFASECGIDVGSGGMVKSLASHQLRRGFSVFFYRGFRLGSLEALNRQLRHTDLSSTRIYVSEAEAGGMISLQDACEARHAIALETIGQKDRAWLFAAKARLLRRRAAGRPFDEALCEELAHALLQAWPNGGNTHTARPVSEDPRFMGEGAAAGIRIGSQARRPAADDVRLIDLVRAYVSATAPQVVLS